MVKLLLNTQPMNWDELRKSVKNCQFDDCPRYKDKFKILFNREESSLSKIKFVVVSQEPGYSLKREHDFKKSSNVEDFLISECLKEPDNKRTPINRVKNIIKKEKFNPTTDEIYWTHALKCVPKESDEDIHKEWKGCASSNCIKHFINELTIIPSKKLIIIPLGNYALTMCRHILEKNHPLENVSGILEYIRTFNINKKFPFKDKEILLFPFVHPSKRDMVLKNREQIKTKEKGFIDKIKEFL